MKEYMSRCRAEVVLNQLLTTKIQLREEKCLKCGCIETIDPFLQMRSTRKISMRILYKRKHAVERYIIKETFRFVAIPGQRRAHNEPWSRVELELAAISHKRRRKKEGKLAASQGVLISKRWCTGRTSLNSVLLHWRICIRCFSEAIYSISKLRSHVPLRRILTSVSLIVSLYLCCLLCICLYVQLVILLRWIDWLVNRAVYLSQATEWKTGDSFPKIGLLLKANRQLVEDMISYPQMMIPFS